jgi:hypothetical protein
MSGKWSFRLWVALGILCMAHAVALAAPPWGALVSGRGVDADPNQAYKVTEENGPWMIMTTTFSGAGAEKQAQELVLELRKRYKIPAYTYVGHYDPGEAQARGLDKYGNPKKAKYLKYKDDKQKAKHPEIVEVAVLAGDFQSAGDKRAQATLQTIKYARPQCLEVKDGQATNQTLTGWRLTQQHIYEMMGSEKKNLGPMRHAFIIPNPTLPPDYFNRDTIDDETIALNKGVPNSLLECPGNYTVQVASFKGNAIIRQSDIREIEDGRKQMKSQLAIAAQNAHDLTIYLRAKGYEAYQYHDRFMSIVTVGSFKSAGTRLPNGQLDLDPKIQKVIDVFRADGTNLELEQRADVQNTLTANGLDKQLVNIAPKKVTFEDGHIIPFDVQPLVVRVPKRSFSRAASDNE